MHSIVARQQEACKGGSVVQGVDEYCNDGYEGVGELSAAVTDSCLLIFPFVLWRVNCREYFFGGASRARKDTKYPRPSRYNCVSPLPLRWVRRRCSCVPVLIQQRKKRGSLVKEDYSRHYCDWDLDQSGHRPEDSSLHGKLVMCRSQHTRTSTYFGPRVSLGSSIPKPKRPRLSCTRNPFLVNLEFQGNDASLR